MQSANNLLSCFFDEEMLLRFPFGGITGYLNVECVIDMHTAKLA